MKRILAILILSLMIVSFVAPFLGVNTVKNQTDVAAQEESTEQTKEDKEEIQEVVKEEKSELEIAQEEYDEKLANLNSMNLSKEEWFKQYKILIEEYSNILGKSKTIYDNFTRQELDLLFRVVQAEIGSEYSFEQKCNVVSVIYNRINDYRFGNTINEILVGHQFSTINSGAIYKVVVDERTVLACEYVYLFGDTTNGALFFDSNGRLNYKFLFNDGAHNFYTKRK
jgi:spore germination cell wall hydrolase CwlJ-like protein